MGIRFAIIIGCIFAGYGFLLFHLYQVQMIRGGYYLARAESESVADATAANRGVIYFTDSSGDLLPAALNQNFPLIYAVPEDITNPQSVASQLAPILNIPESNLLQTLSNPSSSYANIETKADPAAAATIQNLNLTGIYVDEIPERFYPEGAVASQVLGFVGPNATNGGESGHYGIEGYYNSTLSGIASGTNFSSGANIDLTIDPNIQIEAEKILDDLVAANGATGGSVIVEDPRTGKILAMGATPDFDPNNYQSSTIADYLNTNVESQYEPGSIMKVLTMAAGIDAGKITPNTTYDDKGYVEVDGAHITNYNLSTHGPYGPNTTMTQVIEGSINTGAIFAENQTGNAIYLSYLKKFRLDQKTGIDLPGEITGDMSQLTSKAPQVDWDTAAYGQGVSVTPIGLVQAVAALANGGVMMRPYLNAALSPEVIGHPVSSSTARQVTQMMVDAVDDAHVANIAGYSLAGKTGSAYIPDLVHGGYLNELTDSYIGFGPASNPQFIAFIRLNTVPVTSLAAESVVPAWKELAQYIINYESIAPDRIGSQ